MRGETRGERERMARKEEIERMARKEEMERMARKEEIERKKEEMEQHTKLELARIELEKAKIAAGQSKESNSSGFERPKVKLLQFVEGRDDMEAFLHRFQLTASAHRWNKEERAPKSLAIIKELTTHYKSAYPDRPIGKDAIVANTATFTKKVKEQPTDVRPSARPNTRGYQQPFPLAQRRRAYSTGPNWQYRNNRQNEYQGPRRYGSNQLFNQYGQYRYNEGNSWHMNPRGRGQSSRDRFRRGGRSLTYRGDDQKGRNPQNNKFANVAQDRAVLTALSARIHEKPGLKLRTGRVNGKKCTAMFDSGCNTIGVY
ncbi:hypothetical protein ElyMa_006442400 [Elysia marginata]|uniref:Uncharacterized protein n=1 Tax=Elysia marginata TaxID=1093978 RepID=A0AAV4I0T8_9GAST|nr:hypothetical protein ElyMa_006442400 [Elysia marginata]